MKDLKQLQQEMQNYILKQDKDIVEDVVAPENMPVIGRLDVYRNGYYLRLVESLSGDFPILCQVMGKSAFDAMARDYLDSHPSKEFSIRDVGQYLSDFLSRHKEVHPAYVELAVFEWLLSRAEIAPNQRVFTLEALASTPQEQWPALSFPLHQSVNILSCCYNSVERWENLCEGNQDPDMRPLESENSVLIWRNGQGVQYKALTSLEKALLQLLQSQPNFATLCDNLVEHFPSEEEAIHWLAERLQEWIQLGLFAEMRIAS